MTVGTIEVHLRLDGCRSLKEKRQALRPLIERLRRELRASVAEVGDQDLWNVATLGVAVVGSSSVVVQSTIERALALFDEEPDVVVEGVVRETY